MCIFKQNVNNCTTIQDPISAVSGSNLTFQAIHIMPTLGLDVQYMVTAKVTWHIFNGYFFMFVIKYNCDSHTLILG